MDRRKHQHGFTLVELIIALLLLSMVMTLCASGFRFGTRVWDAVNTQAENIDKIQAVQGFVRRSLSSALVHDLFIQDDEEGDLEQMFIGDPDRIKYVSYSPRYGVDDFLYQYELYLNHESNQLVLQYRPYNKFIKDSKTESVFTLVEGVREIQIEYFSGFEEEIETDSSWSNYWAREFSLPLLVRVTLEMEDGSKFWPQFVVQMRNGPYVVR